MANAPSINKTLCKHCHETVIAPFNDSEDNIFCCQGCLSVYAILKAGNLEKFYSIQKQTGQYTRPVTEIEDAHFDYLDQESFQSEYATSRNSQLSMSFYLKGVHCLACLWLIENLPKLVGNVSESRLNIGKSLVTITLKKDESSFKKAAEALNNLGYPPFPISNQDDIEKLKTKEERALLLRIGIAGFSMMNIMLYTGSVYAGASGSFFTSFGLLSFILSLPVVFYSATPFYQSAWAAIKGKRVNIDIPLSIAIILGFIVSTYFYIKGREYFYYDSIATLTFLILLSRFILRKVQQTSLNKNDLVGIFQRGTTQRKTSQGEYEHILPTQLKVDDIIKVMPNQVFPCDGVIIEGNTRVNLSTLTGESQNILHGINSHVFMGTLNVSSPVIIKVTEAGESTRLGNLLRELEEQEKEKSHFNYLTDKVSKYFVQGVLFLAALTFLITFKLNGFETALENSLALIIVTCPCALGLATPLAFSRILGLGQRHNIIIKTEGVLERLINTKHIFFDKTGTLTKGEYVVTDVDFIQPRAFEQISAQDLTFSLEGKSSHPVAKALVEWAKQEANALSPIVFDSYEEILGYGISAHLNNDTYDVFTIEAPIQNENKSTLVVINKNAQTIIKFTLQDEIKPESREVIQTLKKQGYNLHLLSGDKKTIVQDVSNKLGLDKKNIQWAMSPEEKAKKVSQYKQTLFIGDGANDSLAFNQSDASIATHGSVEVSLRVADIFLTQPNLNHIPKVLFLAKKAVRTVKINLTFSLVYNITGAILAVLGLIGPLEAAILMPLSSLTVLGLTLFNTRESILGAQNGNS